MADFVETSNTKTAVRELIAPIADVNTFNVIVQGVITGNPFGCTAYTVGDVPQDPVMKGRETYTAHVIYQDAEANVTKRWRRSASTREPVNFGENKRSESIETSPIEILNIFIQPLVHYRNTSIFCRYFRVRKGDSPIHLTIPH